jgi:ankyrin repeat protein
VAGIARISQLTDRLGQTSLHQAAGRGWPEVVTYLLEHGANPALQDAAGRTPLVVATTPVQGVPVPSSDRIADILKAAVAGAR